MVSNKKGQRYQKSILGGLDFALERLEQTGDFSGFNVVFKDEELSGTDFFKPEVIKKTSLYQAAVNLDKNGTFADKFVNDVIEKIRNANNAYLIDNKVESFVLDEPFIIDGIKIPILYSTKGAKDLNENFEVKKRLLERTICTTSDWNGKLFGSIANQYGQFYGVEYCDIKSFVDRFESEEEIELDFDLDYYHIFTEISYMGRRIISPNSVNINTYLDPSKNEMTPERKAESDKLLGL